MPARKVELYRDLLFLLSPRGARLLGKDAGEPLAGSSCKEIHPPVLILFWSKYICFISPPPGHSEPKTYFYFYISYELTEWHCVSLV